jgi:hypothetical protein
VPDGTQCALSGCPGIAACLSATCTCQIPSDLGPTDPTMADGGSQPVKHSRGCAITGVGERAVDTSLALLFVLAALAVLAVTRRRLA